MKYKTNGSPYLYQSIQNLFFNVIGFRVNQYPSIYTFKHKMTLWLLLMVLLKNDVTIVYFINFVWNIIIVGVHIVCT